ncbi:Tll0287-like domain-containing protein [Plasticicumulans acidivorans]|uniref:Uncharacterized protein DUF3365 n=1 Tax=Plasticicumulans acidivorans TaxID=886464 RepID=A0A317MYT7_9GAMM|nr:DUF3365 domain-containing protein [Plasticicumulans acidivorans]PWV64795.1 uncharacterized protein DUF3365 [Plasticicumulans acidivorans]
MLRRSLLCCAVLIAAPAFAADEADALVAQSRTAVQSFGGQLKTALSEAIAAGGPVNGIAVCNEKAPGIAAQASAASGLDVARTSLKVRNPGNEPDAWERSMLEQFDARKAAGEPADTLEAHAIVEEDGVRTFRYMKAIPTAQLCLNCHGADLKPEVAAKIDALYPQDRARGYAAGDLRGAFTVRKVLAEN